LDVAQRWYDAVPGTSGAQRAARLLVDDVDDGAMRAFDARPERLYVVEGATVLFRGGPGPFEYSVADMCDALDAIVASKKKKANGGVPDSTQQHIVA